MELVDRCQCHGSLIVIGDKGCASRDLAAAMRDRDVLILRRRRKDEPGDGPHLAPDPPTVDAADSATRLAAPPRAAGRSAA